MILEASPPKGHTFAHKLAQISSTIRQLEESIRSSQILERKQFMNEVQLHIDKHQLSLNLDQEKYNNRRLALLAKTLSIGSSNVGKFELGDNLRLARTEQETSRQLHELSLKYEELKKIVRRREIQIRKIKGELDQAKVQRMNVVKLYKIKSNQFDEVILANQLLKCQVNNLLHRLISHSKK